MNRNTISVILSAAAILAVTGCNLVLNTGASQGVSGNPTQDNKSRLTEVFKTQIAREAEWTLAAAVKPSSTPTLLVPSFTPTITLTPTSEKVTVTVTKNTNCRTGPEKQFDLVGVMKVGETAEAIGRNADKTYWVIHLPSNPAKTCWLWYEWATLTGNGDALPIIESPPTPTWSPKPDFTFYYVGLATCAIPKIIRLQINNTGNIPWESYRVHTKDMVTSNEWDIGADNFGNGSDPGCAAPAFIPAIGPGETAYAIGVVMDPATHGHIISVDLHLYTQNGAGGTHIMGDFSFTMP